MCTNQFGGKYPVIILRQSGAQVTGGPGNFLPDECDLVVLEPFFIEPVGTGYFLEGMDGRLDAFRPRYRDQFDIAVDVADGKDSPAAGLVVGVDCDAAVVIECQG